MDIYIYNKKFIQYLYLNIKYHFHKIQFIFYNNDINFLSLINRAYMMNDHMKILMVENLLKIH